MGECDGFVSAVAIKFNTLLCSLIFVGVRFALWVRKIVGVVDNAPNAALAQVLSMVVKFLMKYCHYKKHNLFQAVKKSIDIEKS